MRLSNAGLALAVLLASPSYGSCFLPQQRVVVVDLRHHRQRESAIVVRDSGEGVSSDSTLAQETTGSKLRDAYDMWRARFHKETFDEERFWNFKQNYIALSNANAAAIRDAMLKGRSAPDPLQLNEFGDWSVQEYRDHVAKYGKSGKKQGAATPQTMAPNHIDLGSEQSNSFQEMIDNEVTDTSMTVPQEIQSDEDESEVVEEESFKKSTANQTQFSSDMGAYLQSISSVTSETWATSPMSSISSTNTDMRENSPEKLQSSSSFSDAYQAQFTQQPAIHESQQEVPQEVKAGPSSTATTSFAMLSSFHQQDDSVSDPNPKFPSVTAPAVSETHAEHSPPATTSTNEGPTPSGTTTGGGGSSRSSYLEVINGSKKARAPSKNWENTSGMRGSYLDSMQSNLLQQQEQFEKDMQALKRRSPDENLYTPSDVTMPVIEDPPENKDPKEEENQHEELKSLTPGPPDNSAHVVPETVQNSIVPPAPKRRTSASKSATGAKLSAKREVNPIDNTPKKYEGRPAAPYSFARPSNDKKAAPSESTSKPGSRRQPSARASTDFHSRGDRAQPASSTQPSSLGSSSIGTNGNKKGGKSKSKNFLDVLSNMLDPSENARKDEVEAQLEASRLAEERRIQEEKASLKHLEEIEAQKKLEKRKRLELLKDEEAELRQSIKENQRREKEARRKRKKQEEAIENLTSEEQTLKAQLSRSRENKEKKRLDSLKKKLSAEAKLAEANRKRALKKEAEEAKRRRYDEEMKAKLEEERLRRKQDVVGRKIAARKQIDKMNKNNAMPLKSAIDGNEANASIPNTSSESKVNRDQPETTEQVLSGKNIFSSIVNLFYVEPEEKFKGRPSVVLKQATDDSVSDKEEKVVVADSSKGRSTTEEKFQRGFRRKGVKSSSSSPRTRESKSQEPSPSNVEPKDEEDWWSFDTFMAGLDIPSKGDSDPKTSRKKEMRYSFDEDNTVDSRIRNKARKVPTEQSHDRQKSEEDGDWIVDSFIGWISGKAAANDTEAEPKPNQESRPRASIPKTNVSKANIEDCPSLSMWVQNSDGSITGYISNSPDYLTGTRVTTSSLKARASENSVVTTQSGSNYRLGTELKEEAKPSSPSAAKLPLKRREQFPNHTGSSELGTSRDKGISLFADRSDSSVTDLGKKTKVNTEVPVLMNWHENTDGSITGTVEGRDGQQNNEVNVTISPRSKEAKAGSIIRSVDGQEYLLALMEPSSPKTSQKPSWHVYGLSDSDLERIPILANWKQNPDGTITGSVTNMKKFKDGTFITTSPVRHDAVPGSVVKTGGGSLYRLM